MMVNCTVIMNVMSMMMIMMNMMMMYMVMIFMIMSIMNDAYGDDQVWTVSVLGTSSRLCMSSLAEAEQLFCVFISLVTMSSLSSMRWCCSRAGGRSGAATRAR